MSLRYLVMVSAAALALNACSKNQPESDAKQESAATERAASDRASEGPRKIERPALEAVDEDDTDADDNEKVLGVATTTLQSLGDSSVEGTVTFTEKERTNADGDTERFVVVSYDISGLEPDAPRGFHIHEHGDCSSDDGMSAGGHFNPGDHDHGDLSNENTHAGDLGNVTADAEGKARGDILGVSKITLDENEDSYIVGRSVIVHEDEDDLHSQPTGDAGGRVACGVIAEEAGE